MINCSICDSLQDDVDSEFSSTVLNEAVRGMKDLLRLSKPSGLHNTSKLGDITESVAGLSPPQPPTMRTNARFLDLLSFDGSSATTAGSNDAMDAMQTAVRAEMWNGLVSVDMLNRQVDRNLGLYSDLTKLQCVSLLRPQPWSLLRSFTRHYSTNLTKL